MHGRFNDRSLAMTNEHADDGIQVITERFERRLAEETGKLRVEMASGFGEMKAALASGLGCLRAEMIERNHELLKWALVFWATQIAAVAALLALYR